MSRTAHLTTALVLLGLFATVPGAARADGPIERRLCIFDPGGAVGDAFQMMQSFQAAALEWGVRFEMRPYTDERTAAEDFNAGRCHAALLTGVRARQYNRFAGTIEAMGAVESYDNLKRVLDLVANPRAGARMVQGNYETLAIFPAGAVYLFLRDRSLANVSELAGKRIATLDFDRAAVVMVDRVGASMVPADVGTFAGMFNNAGVDACYAPATAYGPLELERGLQSGGGVARYPLSQLTLQMVAHRDQFPEDFGIRTRRYAAQNFDQVMGLIRRAEAAIPERYWIDVAAEDRAGYDHVFREVRIQLRDQNVYDGTMLTLLRRVRCQADGSRAECADQRE